MQNLRNFDLNQLVVLDALFRFESVTQAAEFLNLSQPAVSIALRKLRDQYRDPLFIKSDGRLQPTPLALGLKSKIADIIAEVGDVVSQADDFDPLTSSFHFRIGMPEYASFSMMNSMMEALNKYAPKAQLTIINVTRYDDIEDRLSKDIGLVVGNFNTSNTQFKSIDLFEDDYICLYQKNRFGGRAITQGDFLNASHIRIGMGYDVPSIIDENIASYGHERRNVITVPHYILGLKLSEQFGHVFTSPKRLSLTFMDHFHLDYADYPFLIEKPMISCLWHQRTDNHKAYMWFKNMLADIFGG